jgi:hypothetical protein
LEHGGERVRLGAVEIHEPKTRLCQAITISTNVPELLGSRGLRAPICSGPIVWSGDCR